MHEPRHEALQIWFVVSIYLFSSRTGVSLFPEAIRMYRTHTLNYSRDILVENINIPFFGVNVGNLARLRASRNSEIGKRFTAFEKRRWNAGGIRSDSIPALLINGDSLSSFRVINRPSNHVELAISTLTRGTATILRDIVVHATAETWLGWLDEDWLTERVN